MKAPEQKNIGEVGGKGNGQKKRANLQRIARIL
jgi:hypothetical protein